MSLNHLPLLDDQPFPIEEYAAALTLCGITSKDYYSDFTPDGGSMLHYFAETYEEVNCDACIFANLRKRQE